MTSPPGSQLAFWHFYLVLTNKTGTLGYYVITYPPGAPHVLWLWLIHHLSAKGALYDIWPNLRNKTHELWPYQFLTNLPGTWLVHHLSARWRYLTFAWHLTLLLLLLRRSFQPCTLSSPWIPPGILMARRCNRLGALPQIRVDEHKHKKNTNNCV